MNRLSGKVAIITGANSGIGETTAELFASEGASLILAARRLDKLEEVANRITAQGGRALCISADVSKIEDCHRIVEDTIKEYGHIDVLVNNAGMADKHRPITRCDVEWWNAICSVNQNSVFYMMKEVLRFMEPTHSGSIVNISSIGGIFGNSGIAYSASKTAVIGMTKNVAIQFAGLGIRCNAVCPGPTPTPLNTPEQLATFDSFAKVCAAHMDMTRPQATTADQAKAILFFSCDDSNAITGQYLIVDNGTTL
jgi:NAD(P)-dependent dehydrogenase (short-subunit alcohol dehydrogenase family)